MSYTIEDHFRDRPASLREAFDYLLERAREFGPVRVDAVKTGINLASRFHFAMVYVQKSRLRLGFVSDGPLRDRRILRTEKLAGSKYAHEVTVIDTQLIHWLREAYSSRE